MLCPGRPFVHILSMLAGWQWLSRVVGRNFILFWRLDLLACKAGSLLQIYSSPWYMLVVYLGIRMSSIRSNLMG